MLNTTHVDTELVLMRWWLSYTHFLSYHPSWCCLSTNVSHFHVHYSTSTRAHSGQTVQQNECVSMQLALCRWHTLPQSAWEDWSRVRDHSSCAICHTNKCPFWSLLSAPCFTKTKSCVTGGGGVFPPPAGNPLWLSSQAEDTLDSQSRERRLSPFPRDLLLAPAPAQMPILHNLSLSLPRSLSLSPSLPFSLTSCSPSRVDSLCTHLHKHRIYPLCCRWMLCHFKSLHISRPTVSEPVSPERSDENDADNDA